MNPQDQYTAVAAEWAALLALAAEANPAEASADGGWRAELFASEGTGAAFAAVSQAKRATRIDAPAGIADEARELLTGLGDDALDALRTDLGRWAMARAALAQLSAAGREALGTVHAAQARGQAPDLGTLLRGLQGALDDAAAFTAGDESTRATLGDLAGRYWDFQAERRDAVPTGLGTLDKKLGDGFQPRRLICLLGAPGKGKTTLANQIGEHIANGGRPVVYLTTEDTPLSLLHRTVARIGDMDYGQVQRGTKAHEDEIRWILEDLAKRRSASRLLYIDGYAGIRRLRAIARAHFKRFASDGPGLIVCDYLQRMARSERGDTEVRLAVSDLAGKLSDLAKELNCSVLALGSQNRGAYAGGTGAKPAVDALASGKESGDIEYNVDVLLTLSSVESPRWDVPPGQKPMGLSIPKNRQGETTDSAFIPLNFYGARQKFTAVASRGE